MKQFVIIAAFLFYFYGVHARKLPETFTVCKKSAKDYNQCLKTSIKSALVELKDGNPNLGILPIDPLVIESLAFTANQAGSIRLSQNYKDIKVYNLSMIDINEAEIVIDKKNNQFRVSVNAVLPTGSIEGDYDFDGMIMVMPIKSAGKMKLICTDLRAIIDITGTTVGAKGKEYLKATNSTVTLIPTDIKFHFDHPFNGNQKLSEEILKIIDENWKDLFKEVQPGYEQALECIVKSVINGVFYKVSLDDIYPE